MIFLKFEVSSWGTHLSFFTFPIFQIFKFPNLKHLLQMLKNCGMVEVEFLDNFSCSYNRISFDDHLSWSSTSNGVTAPFIFKVLCISFTGALIKHCFWVFQDETSIWIGRLSKVYCPPQCRHMYTLIYLYLHIFKYVSHWFFLWRTLTNTVGLEESLTIFATASFYQWRR